MIYLKKDAIISDNDKHRYCLSRIWSNGDNIVAFIGLNPSTADANKDDSTITKCVNYAKQWGFDGLYMINLFSFRATDKEEMLKDDNPTNAENDKCINKYINKANKVICAWGNDGVFKNRHKYIIDNFENLYCLTINKTGQPHHPMYLKLDIQPIKYK